MEGWEGETEVNILKMSKMLKGVSDGGRRDTKKRGCRREG